MQVKNYELDTDGYDFCGSSTSFQGRTFYLTILTDPTPGKTTLLWISSGAIGEFGWFG